MVKCLLLGITILLSVSFSHWRYLVVFYWSLREGKSSKVSGTLLSILDDLKNMVIWLVGWVLWHINLCRLFNAKSIFM